MNPKATKSTFSSINLRLSLIALGVVTGFFSLTQLFIAPRLVEDRAQAIFSTIRSHESDIVLNKTRSVRDELITSGAIKEDQNFAHYFSDESSKIKPLLTQCRFISPSICLGEASTIFFVANSSQPPKDSFKFAVVLENDLSRTPTVLLVWEMVAASMVALAFWLLRRAILKKEKYLLDRLAVAATAFERAQVLFSSSKSGHDEFDIFGKTAEDLVLLLEEYKAKFERKTRLEQLGLTIGQVSHDLKAPLNEAENFLSTLPKLLEKAPRETILAATESLILRIRSGKHALNQALLHTKQATVAREALHLREVFLSVTNRAKNNAKLQDLTFEVNVSDGYSTFGDRLRLETAFLNLLENTADEKKNAKVQVTLSELDSSHAKIIYQDNGGGIPAEFLERIFEPLVTYKSTGTGLGLSSTKEILTQHGGYIRAIPYRDGAKFEIVLPVMGDSHA